MALWNRFASSFLSINRMGDTPSTQNVSEAQEEQSARQKAWSPSDISESSDEDTKVTGRPMSPAPNSNSSTSRVQNVKSNKQRKKSERWQRHTEVVTSNPGPVDESAENILANQSNSGSRSPPAAASGYESAISSIGEEDMQEQPAITSDLSADSLDTPYARMLQRPRANSQSSNGTAQSQQSQRSNRQDSISVYACPKANFIGCSKTFLSQHEANEHVQRDHKDKLLGCPVCAKPFTKASSLRKHQLSHNTAENDVTDQQNGVQEPIQDELDSSVEQPRRERPVATNGQGAHQTAADIVEETPLVPEGLKRKRSIAEASSLRADRENPRKKQRRQSLSLQASVASEDEQESQTMESTGSHSNSQQLKTLRTKRKNNGSLENFAKPWTPGSNLRHPIHNPASPKTVSSQFAYVAIPRTSEAGPSRTPAAMYRKQRVLHESADSNDEQTPLAQKKTRTIQTSGKGKRRAERDVSYSSPPAAPKPTSGGEEQADRQGLATTVARRTNNQQTRRKALGTDEQSAGESYTSNNDTQSDADEEIYRCRDCKKSFKSKDTLQRHRNKSHPKGKVYECDDCDTTFASVSALQNHQKQRKHGDNTSHVGRKGAFSDGEVRKLDNWRDAFCEEYDISVQTFNQMMTDSCRRNKSFWWPYRYITKNDFLQEYYDVLPARDRRSMHRYRERAFQNIPEKQPWTEQDDEELLRLVKDIGPKWVEIGQLMTRTQDSVNQRWRHKLQYRGKIQQGEWPAEEVQELRDAVYEVKRESGISLDPNAVFRMPWDSVSKKLKGRRTAQQCSNKWRLLYQVREGNQFSKPNDTDPKIGNSSSAATPSKISQRLKGDTPTTNAIKSSTKKQYPSANLVTESDDEDRSIAHNTEASIEHALPEVVTDKDEGEVAVPSNHTRFGQNEVATPESGTRADTPKRVRNPFQQRTPSKSASLSQTFAQTQANTSALRAPTTGRKQHTQTEMPTPGISVQYRRTSSLQSIHASNRSTPIRSGVSAASNPDYRFMNQDNEADIMAEPKSSSEEPLSVSERNPSVSESQTSVSESEADSSGNRHRRGRSANSSSSSGTRSGSDSDSASASGSASSEAAESEDDSMVDDARRDVFMQSLQSSNPGPPASSSTDDTAKHRQKINWKDILHQNSSTQPMDSETDSEDEGDIQHH